MDPTPILNGTISRRAAAATKWDVAVIGGGPAGSVAAMQLARVGRQVLVIERKQFPRYKVCGGCVSAAGMQLLDSIGLCECVRQVSAEDIEFLHVHAFGRDLQLTSRGGLAISRAALDACLLKKAIEAGAQYLPGTKAAVGSLDNGGRKVTLQAAMTDDDISETQVTARLVLAADGLGHPCLRQRAEFSETIADQSHVGAGCELEAVNHQITPHTLNMVVGEKGYIGFVVVEGGRLNVAAALSPSLIRSQGSISGAVSELLVSAGVAVLPALSHAHWQGTPALTRRTHPVAVERLLLLGDSCGYVEPFTGEGITWAIDAALHAVPLANQAIDEWREFHGERWRVYHRHVRQHLQRTCRLITPALRRPWLVDSALAIGHVWPALAQPIAQWINHGSMTARTA